MRTPQPLKAVMVLALLAGALGASAQNAPIETRVLEGALVRAYDPAARTAAVVPCPGCEQLTLTVTERTEIIRDGKHYPFTKDTGIGGYADTMYAPRDKTVLWFRPLGARR